MSYISNKDFLVEVQKGNVPGHSMVHKFGRNDAVGAAWEHVSLLPFTTASFGTTSTTVRMKAGGDNADEVTGAGATEVTVQGIGSTFTEVAEAIATTGITVSSATTSEFWRVYRAWVSGVSTYGAANTGVITIEDSGGAADMISIGAGEGQSQYAGYTIPEGKTGYLLSVHATTDGAKAADIRCFTRDNIDDITAPMSAKRLRLYWDGILGEFNYRPRGPEFSIAEKSDIWFEAKAGASTEVSVDFELLVVDD